MSDHDFEQKESNENSGKLVYEQKFKGRPILVLKKNENDAYPFSFGMSKVRLILDNIQAIEAFAAKYGNEKD